MMRLRLNSLTRRTFVPKLEHRAAVFASGYLQLTNFLQLCAMRSCTTTPPTPGAPLIPPTTTPAAGHGAGGAAGAGSGLRKLVPCGRTQETLDKLMEKCLDANGDPNGLFKNYFYKASDPTLNPDTKVLVKKHNTPNDDIEHRCRTCGCTIAEHLKDKAAAAAAAEPLTVEDLRRAVDYFRRLLGENKKCVITAPLPVSQYKPQQLVFHPTNEMLGDSRTKALNSAVSIMSTDSRFKEDNPFIVLTSAPRQGKSRWLDELCKQLTASSAPLFFPIVITYNGDSILGEDDWNSSTLMARFFARALISIIGADMSVADLIVEQRDLLMRMNVSNFVKIVDGLYETSRHRKVFLVDEFSKVTDQLYQRCDERVAQMTLSRLSAVFDQRGKLVFTGFTTQTAVQLTSSSSRRTETLSLPLVDHSSRDQYAELKNELMMKYKTAGTAFPGFVYEVLKSSPGLLGYWLEMTVPKAPQQKGNVDRELLIANVAALNTPWGRQLVKNASCAEDVDSYLQAWANGIPDTAMQSLLNSMANKSVPTAVAVNLKEGSERFKPHPYAFVLVAEKNASKSMLIAHFDRICKVIERSADGMWSDSPSERQRAKGECFEAVLCLVMKLRLVGMGSKSVQARPWLEAWVGRAIFGSDGVDDVVVKARHSGSTWQADKVLVKDVLQECTPQAGPLCFPKCGKPVTRKMVEGAAKVWSHCSVLKHFNGAPGFDAMAILDSQRAGRSGVVFVAAESKYRFYDDASLFTNTVEKLFTSLCGFCNMLVEMKKAKVRRPVVHHFAFVMVCACDCKLPEAAAILSAKSKSPFFNHAWGVPTVENLICKLQEEFGTTISLHVVAGAEACGGFLTPAVYHMLPDNEWLLDRALDQTFTTSTKKAADNPVANFRTTGERQ